MRPRDLRNVAWIVLSDPILPTDLNQVGAISEGVRDVTAWGDSGCAQGHLFDSKDYDDRSLDRAIIRQKSRHWFQIGNFYFCANYLERKRKFTLSGIRPFRFRKRQLTYFAHFRRVSLSVRRESGDSDPIDRFAPLNSRGPSRNGKFSRHD